MRKYYIIFIIFIILTSISLPVRIEGKTDNKYYSYSTRRSRSSYTFGKKNTYHSHSKSTWGIIDTIIICVIVIILIKNFLKSRK